MSNGTITGDEVLKGVVERVKAVDTEFKTLLGTYNQLTQTLTNTSSISGINTVLKQKNDADEKQISIIKEVTNLEKQRSTQVRKTAGATRTNIAAIKSLNNFYLQQSRLLNDLRNRYKALEVKKQLSIKLTKAEQIEYAKLRKQVISLDSALKKTDAAAGQFQRNVGNYAKGSRLLISSLRSLAGAFGFTSGIFLFAAALKDAFTRVREFDKSMQNLSGILRTTRKDLRPVETEIIKVAGASIKTSREVAELAESLATLGKRGQDLINLIKPANDLSIALGTSSADAAEFLVQNLNAFGASSTEAANYADVIATIRTSTSLDFQRMRDSFQYLTPISRILGEDLAFTGGIIGVLSDNSIKAEQGARLLGTAQQKLAKDGISLNDALEQINKAQSEGAEGLELLALTSNLFGKQAAKVGIVLANNRDRIEEYANSIRNSSGALDDLVNQQLESLDAKIKILDSTWEQLILTIDNGQGSMSQFFKSGTEGLTEYLQGLIEVEKAQGRVFEVTGQKDTSTSFFGLIKTLNPEYEKLVEKQKEFNGFVDRLSANPNIRILKSEYKLLSDELDNNNGLTLQQRELYRAQLKEVENLIIGIQKNRDSLQEQAFEIVNTTGKFEEYRLKIQSMTNNELEEFIKKNRDVAKSLSEINNDFENEDFKSLDSLKEKLKSLREAFGKTDIESDQFQTLKEEIANLEDYIAKLEGKRLKRRTDENKKIIQGTIEYYENLIKQEVDFQKTEARTASAILISNERVKKYQEGIDRLRGAFEKLDTIRLGVINLELDENNIDKFKERILKSLEEDGFDLSGPLDELEKFNEARKNSEKIYTEFLKDEREKQRDLSSRIFGELFGTFSSYYNLDLRAFHDLIEGKKGLEIDYAATINSISTSLLQGKIAKYEAEISKNKETLDTILNDKNASDAKKEQAQKEFNKKEAALNKKKAEAEREALLFQISLDTAQTVTKALLNAYALLSNPLTAALAPNAFAQAAVAGAFGAAQLAFISSKPLPEFYQGKTLENHFEGMATWGEKRKEVKIGADGNIEISPNKTTPLFVKKDDIIVPSLSRFEKDIKNPSSDVARRLSQKLNTDISQNSRLFKIESSSIDSKLIADTVGKEIAKYANRPILWSGTINQSSTKRRKYHV